MYIMYDHCTAATRAPSRGVLHGLVEGLHHNLVAVVAGVCFGEAAIVLGNGRVGQDELHHLQLVKSRGHDKNQPKVRALRHLRHDTQILEYILAVGWMVEGHRECGCCI